jgi:hypothetical protein
VRTDDDEPSPEATRRALRDVVGRCLYGIDVNPMAVELFGHSLDGGAGAGPTAQLRAICRHFRSGPRTALLRLIRKQKCPFAGTLRDGSDGTRTLDLERDRPAIRAPKALRVVDVVDGRASGWNRALWSASATSALQASRFRSGVTM